MQAHRFPVFIFIMAGTLVVSGLVGANEVRGQTNLIRSQEIVSIFSQPVEPGSTSHIQFSEDQIPFDLNKATIKPEARPQLDEMAAALKVIEARLLIVGHTDLRGSEEYNQKLSERRARAVYDYLVARGVSRDKLAVEGRGELEPLCLENTEPCHYRNRRVELRRMSSVAEEDTGGPPLRANEFPEEDHLVSLTFGAFYRTPGGELVNFENGGDLDSSRSGFTFYLRTDERAYLYVYRNRQDGRIELLYPSEWNSTIEPDIETWIPSRGEFYRPATVRGFEEVYVLVLPRALSASPDLLEIPHMARRLKASETERRQVEAPPSYPPIPAVAGSASGVLSGEAKGFDAGGSSMGSGSTSLFGSSGGQESSSSSLYGSQPVSAPFYHVKSRGGWAEIIRYQME